MKPFSIYLNDLIECECVSLLSCTPMYLYKEKLMKRNFLQNISIKIICKWDSISIEKSKNSIWGARDEQSNIRSSFWITVLSTLPWNILENWTQFPHLKIHNGNSKTNIVHSSFALFQSKNLEDVKVRKIRMTNWSTISMWKTIISKENIWCGNKNTLFLIPFWSWTNISSEERRDFYHNSSTTFSDFWISERMKWTTNQFKQVFFSSSCFGYFSTSILSQIIWDIIRLENKPNFSRHCHICSKMAEF